MNDAALKNVSLFEGLEESTLRAIASHAVTRTFPKNAILISEGDHSDALYVILSGRVKIYYSDEDGKEIVLSTLGPDGYFGELALIDGEPRSASVMTLESTRMLIIARRDFMQYLSSEPVIALNLLKVVVRKLRRETEQVKNLALMDVYGRTAKLLLERAEEQEGRWVVERLTHREIADRIGASREMIGRIFKELKRGGYITVEPDRIVINEHLPKKW